MKLLEDSEYLSNEIIYRISQKNSKNEFPFKKLEVNILLDCARTISETEKAHAMLQVCSLATLFYSLEIPYLISLVEQLIYLKIIMKMMDLKESFIYLRMD